jgi:acylphosphatase
VYGRVQGVGFRWFVRDQARRLGVRGTVRNRDDGSVEVHASGAETTISKLRALLYDGPPGAAVERIEETVPPTVPLPESFTILS